MEMHDRDKQKEMFQTMTEDFLKFLSDTKLQIQEASRTQSRINSRKTTLAYDFQTTEVKDKEKS